MSGLGPKAVALAFAFAPSPLPADGSLEFRGPTNLCPDNAYVVALLGEHTADVEIDTRVDALALAHMREDGSWSIELTTRVDGAEPTTRSFDVESCEAGAQAVALAVAMTIAPAASSTGTDRSDRAADDPAAVEADDQGSAPIPEPPAPITTAPRPGSESRPLPERVSAPSPAPPVRDRDRPRPRAVIGMAGGVTGGLLPRVGGLLVGSVGVTGRRWRVLARVEHEVRHVFELQARPGATGRLSLLAGGIEAGPVFRAGPLEVPVTAGAIVGGIRAVGDGASINATRAVPWGGLLLGTGVTWAPIPRVAIGVRGELVAALVRHSFGFEPDLPLVRSGWVGGRGLALIEVRLP